MKTTTILLALIFSLNFGACNSSSKKQEQSTKEHESLNHSTPQVFNLDTMQLRSGDVFYQCEMDLAVISDKFGNCPKCKMKLVEHKKN